MPQSTRRIKLILVVVVILGSALALLAWTQTWVDASVTSQGTAQRHLEVTGSSAAPALTALALAGLALAGALTIAGVVIRVVLGVLEVLLGVSVFIAAFAAVSDPAAASASAVTAATGIAGTESVRSGVVGAALTGWPYLALVAAGIMMVTGVGIVLTARRWPGPTQRYQAVRLEPAEPRHGATGEAGEAGSDAGGDAGSDAIVDWDDLSRGDDPTG